MTDNSWTPPGAGEGDAVPATPFGQPSAPVPPVAPEPSAAPPAFAPPGGFPPPAFAPPGATVPPGAPPAPPSPGVGAGAWTPPPKPGLIPLRPLTLGTLLGASFQVLRRNPRPMFGFSLLLTGAVFLLSVVLMGFFTVSLISRLATATSSDASAIAVGGVAGILLATFIPLALSIAVLAILQGVVVLEVARGTVGEKLTLRGLLRTARGRLWALVGWSMLVTTAATVAVTLTVVLITLLGISLGDSGIGVVVLLVVLAVFAALALGFWLTTRLCLVPSVLVIERLPLRAAVPRAWRLTHGYFWKTLGIQLLVSVILSTVSSIVSLPFSFLLGLSSVLINPNGDSGAAIVVGVIGYVLTLVVSVVIGAISAVVQSATTALIYIDIRMRKEGLDLELARYVEARQAGNSSVPDPYLARQGAAAA